MFNKKVTLVVGGAILASVAAFAVIAGTITAQREGGSEHGAASAIDREVSHAQDISGEHGGVGEHTGRSAADTDIGSGLSRLFEAAEVSHAGEVAGGRDEHVDRSPWSRDTDDLSGKLSRLVAAGELTQADADALTAWFDSKPEVTILSDAGVAKSAVYKKATESDHIARMVTDGIISQADADALTTWLESKPDIELTELGHGRHQGDRDGGWHKFGFDFDDDDYDVAEDMSMLVDKGILTQADADALVTWFNSKPDVAFPESVSDEDVYGHVADDDDADSGVDLASELDEAVAAGDITQADADAILAWVNSVPEVNFSFGSRAKAWIFDGEGDAEHGGITQMFTMLAESGMLTDAESAEITAWIDSMPDFSFNVGKMVKGMMASEFDSDSEEALDVSSMLSELVTKGIITQADSDALQAWWDGKPAIVGTLVEGMEERFGDGHGGRGGRGEHGARFSKAGASY